ncbi:MAG: PAS domain-containing protein [Ferruginibacter sp.]|nr:PAS domain-containing protein [Cytophagales bacterium]
MTNTYPYIDFETLALVASKTSNGVMITDSSGLLEWANDAFYAMTGYGPEEAMGRKPGRLMQGIHSDPVIIQRMSDSLRAGRDFEEEIINYRRDGVPFWGLLSVSPVKDGQGQVERWIGWLMDITQKKNQEEQLTAAREEVLAMAEAVSAGMEQALKKAEGNLYALIEHTTESVWSVNREYQLLTANRVFKETCDQLYGVKLQLGAHFLEQLGQALTDRHLRNYHRWYDRAFAGEIFSVTETVAGGGQSRHFEHSFYPIKAENSEVEGVSVFSKDITHVKNIEHELRQREKALTQINRELDTLIYRSSHDFKGPVASIKGLLNLIRLENGSGVDNFYLQRIEECNQKLEAIIENLFQATYINEEPPKKDQIDFDQLVLELFKSLISTHADAKISLRYSNHLKLPLHSDYYRVSTILRNVLDNSVKYSKNAPDSYVAVRIDQTEDQVRIVVADNGSGIEEHLVGAVFDMFNRSNAKSSGTGLGLYVVKKAVEKLNGTIQLSSRLNDGVQIRILLPNQTT